MDEVVRNKIAIIKRCLKRIHDEYDGHEEEFAYNYTKQDSIILNLQRACESAIDLGMRVVSLRDLGVPQSSRDVFVLLEKAGYINPELSQHLQGMVGFRNVAVHDYQTINLNVVKSILTDRLRDFVLFTDTIESLKG